MTRLALQWEKKKKKGERKEKKNESWCADNRYWIRMCVIFLSSILLCCIYLCEPSKLFQEEGPQIGHPSSV